MDEASPVLDQGADSVNSHATPAATSREAATFLADLGLAADENGLVSVNTVARLLRDPLTLGSADSGSTAAAPTGDSNERLYHERFVALHRLFDQLAGRLDAQVARLDSREAGLAEAEARLTRRLAELTDESERVARSLREGSLARAADSPPIGDGQGSLGLVDNGWVYRASEVNQLSVQAIRQAGPVDIAPKEETEPVWLARSKPTSGPTHVEVALVGAPVLPSVWLRVKRALLSATDGSSVSALADGSFLARLGEVRVEQLEALLSSALAETGVDAQLTPRTFDESLESNDAARAAPQSAREDPPASYGGKE